MKEPRERGAHEGASFRPASSRAHLADAGDEGARRVDKVCFQVRVCSRLPGPHRLAPACADPLRPERKEQRESRYGGSCTGHARDSQGTRNRHTGQGRETQDAQRDRGQTRRPIRRDTLGYGVAAQVDNRAERYSQELAHGVGRDGALRQRSGQVCAGVCGHGSLLQYLADVCHCLQQRANAQSASGGDSALRGMQTRT